MRKNVVLLVAFGVIYFFLSGESLVAQTPYAYNEISFLTQETGIGARALGLGGAYMSLADDYTAVYWNPAALGLVKISEAAFSLSHNKKNVGADFLNSSTEGNLSKTAFGSAGFAYSVDVQRGSLVFAAGYNRVHNLNSLFSYSGYNTGDSYVGTQFTEPYVPHSVTQDETIELTGDLSQYTFGVSVEVAEKVFVGGAFNVWHGERVFNQIYYETDTQNLYTVFPDDFDYYSQENIYKTDISGYDLKLGLLYKYSDNINLSALINSPRSITLNEDWSVDENMYFDDGEMDDFYDTDDNGNIEYKIKTPFVFGFGLSYLFPNASVSGEIQYTDWTQLKYTGESPFNDASTSDLNRNINQTLSGTFNPRIGAEYFFPENNIVIRAGYSLIQNPVKNSLNSDKNYFSGGLGLNLGDGIFLDLAYIRGTWDSTTESDFNVVQVKEDHTDQRFFTTLRFNLK